MEMELLDGGYPLFRKFINDVLDIRKADGDAAIAVTGAKGMGKSTFALQCGVRMDPNFSIPESYAWDFDEFEDKLKNDQERFVLIQDEAIFTLFGQEWSSPIQKKMIKLLTISRKYHKVTFFNIPSFTALNARARELFTYWVWIPARGHAFVFGQIGTGLVRDPWYLDELEKIVKKTNVYDINTLHEKIKKVPSFLLHFKFPKAPERLYKKYKKYSDEAKDKMFEEKDEGVKKSKLSGYIGLKRTPEKYLPALYASAFALSLLNHDKRIPDDYKFLVLDNAERLMKFFYNFYDVDIDKRFRNFAEFTSQLNAGLSNLGLSLTKNAKSGTTTALIDHSNLIEMQE